MRDWPVSSRFHPRWLNRNVLGTGIVSLLSDAGHEIVTSLLPAFLTLSTALGGLGASAAVLGLIEGFSDGLSSLAKPISGFISDKTNKRKPWMNFGYISTGILLPAAALVQNWFQLAILRVSAWVGRGLRGPPRDALLSDSVERENYGKAFGFHRMMDTLGAIMGPVLVLLLLPILGIRGTILFALIPGTASAVIVIFYIKEVKRFPHEGKKSPTFKASLTSLSSGFRRLLIAQGIFGIGNFANSLFVLAAISILSPSMGAIAATSAGVGLYVLLNIIYAVGSYPVGILADRHSKAVLLGLGYLFNALACLGLILWTNNLIFLGLIFAAVGLQLAFTDTSEAALAAELLPKQVMGTGYGVLELVDGVGDFLSSFIVGVLWVALSPQIGLFYSAILSILAMTFIIVGVRAGSSRSKMAQMES